MTHFVYPHKYLKRSDVDMFNKFFVYNQPVMVYSSDMQKLVSVYGIMTKCEEEDNCLLTAKGRLKLELVRNEWKDPNSPFTLSWGEKHCTYVTDDLVDHDEIVWRFLSADGNVYKTIYGNPPREFYLDFNIAQMGFKVMEVIGKIPKVSDFTPIRSTMFLTNQRFYKEVVKDADPKSWIDVDDDFYYPNDEWEGQGLIYVRNYQLDIH